MLNFDEDRFIRIQSGAVGLADRIYETVGTCLDEGVENLFFLGTGGAAILMEPAFQILMRKSTFPVFRDMSAEVVRSGSVHLGPKSLVVIPSLSGTTAESVESLVFSKRQGASVLSFVGHGETPLGQEADHAFVNFAEDDTSCESFYLQALLLALSLMSHRGECSGYQDIVSELGLLPELLLKAKMAFQPQALPLAEAIQDSTYHIISGAGATWPEAFYYGMCILEEMQWIRTRPVHASDFFHGTLELVEPGVSTVLLKGEDEFRPLVERVDRFVHRYTDRVAVLDAAEVDLPGVSEGVRAMISPIVLATLLERVSAHLEVLRDHPLSTRRYYKRVEY
jgi:fructoselysine-6-phosphate deglycase